MARCSASCTVAASAGALRAWRSRRPRWTSRASARRSTRSSSTTAAIWRWRDGTYELGILSHVLEHVPDPPALLGEIARACRAVVVEVPLEANLSAGRAAKREHADEVGHLQRLSRADAREIVARAGLRIAVRAGGSAAARGPPLPRPRHVIGAGQGHRQVGRARRPAPPRATPRQASLHRALRVPVPAGHRHTGRPGNSIAYVLATWPKSTAIGAARWRPLRTPLPARRTRPQRRRPTCRPTRSPTRTSTRAGSAATGAAIELDFTEDARQWREEFTEFERTAALWNYCLFFWGEDAVADNLSPYIDAAPLEEQKYFLTTQQVDEARHAVFFKRFMQEVCGIGDGSMASGLQAIKPQLTPGFRKIFDRLDTMADELRADRSPAQARRGGDALPRRDRGVARPARAALHLQLPRGTRRSCPRSAQGMQNIAADEQRHIGFGVKLLSDLKREDPVGVPKAVAGILRDVTRYTAQVLMPPGWDERYITVFSASYDDVGVEGLTSMTTKLRSAGLADRDAPRTGAAAAGPVAAGDLPARARARAGRHHRRARGPLAARPRDRRAAVRHDPPPGQPRPRAVTGHHLPVGVHRPRHPHLAPDGQQRLERRRAGRGAQPRPAPARRLPGLGRHHRPAARSAARAIATGKLRPRGNPLALGKLGKVFPRG